MRWYHLVSYFVGGMFLANTVPHLVAGISGSPFESPFASPPGEGLSSALVNVLWGLFNLAVGYVLIVRVGRFDLRRTAHVIALGGGVALTAARHARNFAKFHGGDIRPTDHHRPAPDPAQLPTARDLLRFAGWLDNAALPEPTDPGRMEALAVGPHMKSPRNERPECLSPA
jgi:hypothetical protein